MIFRREDSEATDKSVLTAPMSQAQRALWFDFVANGDSVAYHVPTGYRISGPVDIDALQKALDSVVARQSALRTSLHDVQGELVQHIHSRVDVPIMVSRGEIDMSDGAIQGFLHEFSHQPFDLTQPPLVRAAVLVLGPEDHVLALDMHHIVSDLWSRRVLVSEVGAAYNAVLQGSNLDRPPLESEFWEFCVDFQAGLDSDDHSRNVQYHVDRLRGYQPIDFPLTFTRPSVPTFAGAKERFEFPAETRQRIKTFCRENRCTPYMVLASAYLILLGRLSNSGDVAIGTPQAGRSLDYADHIGFFVSVGVLRATVADGADFRSVLTQVRDASLAISSRLVPFEILVEKLAPPRMSGANPIFQHALAFQNVRSGSLELHNATAIELEVDAGASIFDLTLYVYDEPELLYGFAEYATDLFSARMVTRLTSALVNLVQAAIEEPGRPVDELTLLSHTDRRELLEEWGKGNPADEREISTSTVEQVFQWATRTPYAPAIRCGNEALSYVQLQDRVQCLAASLHESGVRPNDLVAICMDRSIDAVATILATWSLGAAYVPLDPKNPLRHTEGLIERAGARLCVTDDDGLKRFAATGRQTECQFWSPPAGDGQRREQIDVHADGRAYVIFTSGSTGLPKGVSVSHRNLQNFLASMQREPGCAKDDSLLAITTFTFDISILELFLPLTVGAAVIVATSDEVSQPEKLGELLEESKATMMQAVPSLWHALCKTGWKGDKKLRVLSGGEALTSELAAAVLERVGALWNLYGPTETTIWSTLKRIEDGRAPTIGSPIANTSVYVLDSNKRPVMPGVPGELYIGGAGVSSGYLNDEERTKECFLSNPFNPGELIYRTGDLVRFNDDRELEYLGRLDQQVKIRGFRIELGEIETALATHPQVGRAAVCSKQSAQSATADLLVAYVEASGAEPSANELRKFLLDRLPSYMVPQQFVTLSALPETSNGKVDRKTLATMHASGYEGRASATRNRARAILSLRMGTPSWHRSSLQRGRIL